MGIIQYAIAYPTVLAVHSIRYFNGQKLGLIFLAMYIANANVIMNVFPLQQPHVMVMVVELQVILYRNY